MAMGSTIDVISIDVCTGASWGKLGIASPSESWLDSKLLRAAAMLLRPSGCLLINCLVPSSRHDDAATRHVVAALQEALDCPSAPAVGSEDAAAAGSEDAAAASSEDASWRVRCWIGTGSLGCENVVIQATRGSDAARPFATAVTTFLGKLGGGVEELLLLD
jgi:hypothetical protein